MDETPQCPEPVIVEDKNHKGTDDVSLNPVIEKRYDFKYYFLSTTEPNNGAGTYEDEAAFATVL